MGNGYFKSAVVVDPKTGLPADYDSLAVSYRGMIASLAQKLNIGPNDVDDATQTILMKFYEKGGLNFYKPEEHQRNGKNPKFSTLFRSWASMFLLQERDKVMIQSQRRRLAGDSETLLDSEEADHSEEIIEQDAAERWIQRARDALVQEGRSDLLPVLYACVDASERGAVVTRADIVQRTGVSLRAASGVLKQLRAVLEAAGMGAESLT